MNRLSKILITLSIVTLLLLNSFVAYHAMLTVLMPNNDSAYLIQIVEVDKQGDMFITASWLWYR